MITSPFILSQFEKCARLPKLLGEIEPHRLPLRDAVKIYFERGIRQAINKVPIDAHTAFLSEATKRGYEYPEGAEPYVLANDCANWIEGAVKICQEIMPEGQEIPPIQAGEHYIDLDGLLCSDGSLHLFRASGAYKPSWSEFCATLASEEIVIHHIQLPQIKSRLISPLITAHKPPVGETFRIAPREQESFGPKWTKHSRWELNFTWNDWREGIEADNALYRFYSRHEYLERPENLEGDIAAMLSAALGENVRKRETCVSCSYRGWCHDLNRDGYLHLPGQDL